MLEPIRPVDEDARLESLRALRLGPGRDDRLERLVGLAARLSDCPMAAVGLVERDREWFTAGVGWTLKELPRAQSLGAHAILGSGAFVVEDLRHDPRFEDHPLATARPGVRFYAGLPLRGPDGGVVGVLCVLDRRPRVLEADRLAALQDVARTIEEAFVAASAASAASAALAASAASAASTGGAPATNAAASLVPPPQARLGPGPEALLDAMPLPAALLGPAGELRFRNAAWAEAAAPGALVAPEDVPAANHLARLRAVGGFHAEDARRLAALVEDVLAGRRDEGALDHGPGGATRTTVRAVGAGASRGVALWHDDRSEQARRQRAEAAADAAAMALAELRGTDRYRRRIVDALSKEINTPLTPLQLQLHLLRSGRLGPLTERQEGALETIARNVARWSQTTQRLLALLLSAPRGQSTDVDVRALAREAAGQYATAALKAGITLAAPPVGAPVRVRTDVEALREVLAEYLEGALRVTPAGGRVTLEVQQDDAEVRVLVRDGGPGLNPQEAARAFDLHDGQGRPALARCRRLVEAAGGRVWVESEGRDGAAFGVAVPTDTPVAA